MAYCGKCGTNVDEGVKFCPSCGNPMEAPASEQQAQQTQQNTAQTDFSAKFANLNNTADTTAEFDQADIVSNKAMGILAYLGPLVFIPMFAAKGSTKNANSESLN